MPRRKHAKAVAWSDPEPHQVVDGPVADADQAIAHPRHPALEPPVQRGLARTEVPLEHVTVVGVDDRGAGLKRQRRGPPDEARLSRVRMDHVWLEPADDANQLTQGERIAHGRDRLPKVRQEAGLGTFLLGKVRHRLLPFGKLSVDE